MHNEFVGSGYVAWFGQYPEIAFLVSLFGCTTLYQPRQRKKERTRTFTKLTDQGEATKPMPWARRAIQCSRG